MSGRRGRGVALFAGVVALLGAVLGGRWATMAASQSVAEGGPTGTAPASGASSPASASSSATPPASAAARTVDGAVEQTPYGPVQVEVTLKGSSITAVRELQSPADEGRSVAINRYAAPMLEQEVLRSQSAQVDTVSGATYTSEGYLQSLQAALDKAGS